jgi:hypothetical protein
MRFESRTTETVTADPGEVHEMPARPYEVLEANLAFYSDPACAQRVEGASLIVLKSIDPCQKHVTIECLPTTKEYRKGQIVTWELNLKRMWDAAWYRSLEDGQIIRAWTQSVEFRGRVVILGTHPAKPQR